MFIDIILNNILSYQWKYQQINIVYKVLPCAYYTMNVANVPVRRGGGGIVLKRAATQVKNALLHPARDFLLQLII